MKDSIPADHLVEWISYLEMEHKKLKSGSSNEKHDVFLSNLTADAWKQFEKNASSPEKLSVFFQSIESKCTETQFNYISKHAKEINGKVQSHTKAFQEQSTELLKKIASTPHQYTFQSALMKHIALSPPEKTCEQAKKIGLFLTDTLQEAPGDVWDRLKHKYKRYNNLPQEYPLFKSLGDQNISSEDFKKKLQHYLKSNMKDEASLIFLADAVAKVQGAVARFNRLSKVSDQKAERSASWVDYTSDYRKGVKDDVRTNDKQAEQNIKQIRDKADLFVGIDCSLLNFSEAQPHTKESLLRGNTYVRGQSGHSCAMLHLVSELKGTPREVDTTQALLLTMLWGVNRGRHSMNDIMLPLDQLNQPLNLNAPKLGESTFSQEQKNQDAGYYHTYMTEKNKRSEEAVNAQEKLVNGIKTSAFLPNIYLFLEQIPEIKIAREKAREAVLNAHRERCAQAQGRPVSPPRQPNLPNSHAISR